MTVRKHNVASRTEWSKPSTRRKNCRCEWLPESRFLFFMYVIGGILLGLEDSVGWIIRDSRHITSFSVRELIRDWLIDWWTKGRYRYCYTILLYRYETFHCLLLLCERWWKAASDVRKQRKIPSMPELKWGARWCSPEMHPEVGQASERVRNGLGDGGVKSDKADLTCMEDEQQQILFIEGEFQYSWMHMYVRVTRCCSNMQWWVDDGWNNGSWERLQTWYGYCGSG